jgi:hypothetical protein
MSKVIAVISLILCITIFSAGTTFAQNSSLQLNPDISLQKSTIVLSKTSSSKMVISNNTSFVDGFATTYRISGTPSDIQYSKSLIISSIVDDFTNATTVGYVKLNNRSDTTPEFGLTNPFASTEKIQEKIKETFDESFVEMNAKSGRVLITCNFGNVLELFSCAVTRQNNVV